MKPVEYSNHPDLRLSPVTFIRSRLNVLSEAQIFTLTMLTFLLVSEIP